MPPGHILLIKTSSLGDIVHNLPVVNDISTHFPETRIDWCVEENFADILRLSPAICTIIPVAIRRWRKQWWHSNTWQEIKHFRARLQEKSYDAVIDTQGLIKSALISAQAKGKRYGYDSTSAREPFASHFYTQSFTIAKNLHAIERNRQLAAKALAYSPNPEINYGISAPVACSRTLQPLAVLLTASSREEKCWPEKYWITLGQSLAQQGINSLLPSGTAAEKQRATRIASAIPGAQVLSNTGLYEIAAHISTARLAIGVDTGLIHLAAALQIPSIALYTASNPACTGIIGNAKTYNLGQTGRPPTPAEVFSAVHNILH